MKEKFCVFTFYSTHLALEFENLLRDNGIEVKLIPVPRQISSSCGLAGRISRQDISEIKKLCEKIDLEYEDIYRIFEGKKEPEIIE